MRDGLSIWIVLVALTLVFVLSDRDTSEKLDGLIMDNQTTKTRLDVLEMKVLRLEQFLNSKGEKREH